jgi:hypothetical protein
MIFCWACAPAPDCADPLAGLRFMSISSCFADESSSRPGRYVAILRNNGCTFHIIHQILDQFLLKQSREMKKKGDLDVESSFWAGFYEQGTVLLRLPWTLS